MRFFKQILVLMLVAGLIAWSFYDWVFIDQGPAYFAADWRRVALVVAMSLAGGLVTFVFMQLPAALRQHVLTGLFGVGVLLALGCCAYTVWKFFELRLFLAESGMLLLFLLFVLGSTALLVFVGFLFWKYYRRIYGPRDTA